VLGRPLRVPDANAGSALGAGYLAGLGTGDWDIATVLARGRRPGEQRLTPSPADAARHDALYARYLRVSAAVQNVDNDSIQLAAHIQR
jgi:sugar (pentulose or hexulose) kinase